MDLSRSGLTLLKLALRLQQATLPGLHQLHPQIVYLPLLRIPLLTLLVNLCLHALQQLLLVVELRYQLVGSLHHPHEVTQLLCLRFQTVELVLQGAPGIACPVS